MSMSKQDLFGRLTAVEDLDDIRVELKAMIAQIEAEAPEPETSFDELAEGFALGTLSALIDAVLPEASTKTRRRGVGRSFSSTTTSTASARWHRLYTPS